MQDGGRQWSLPSRVAGEPPDQFGADNSYQRQFGWRSFFMLNALWLFIGGGMGTLARWGVSGLVARHWGESFPLGTLVINVSGSFLIGLFSGLTGTEGRWMAPAAFRQFFMIGICGGYTTFSSFSLQTLNLAEDAEWLKAGANIFLSLVLCLAGVWLGHTLALYLNTRKGD
jgi:CrcB protein